MRPYLTNPRSITDRALRRLRDSLADLGDLGGVVFDQNSGQIVGGHMRLRSMFGESAGEFNVQDADIELIAEYDPPTAQGTIAEGFLRWRGGRYSFRKVRWDEATFRRANFVANQPAGDWDWNQIANTISIADLQSWGVDPSAWLAQLNTGAGAVRNMIEAEKTLIDTRPQWDKSTELQAKWKTELGQLWILGDHRLLIGDSTKREDVEKVMGEEKAALSITSPPYWVGKEYEREKSIEEIDNLILEAAKSIAWATREDESRIVINTGTGFTTAFDKRKKRQTLLLIDRWTNAFWDLGWNLRYIRHWLKHGQLASISAKADMIDQHCEWFGVFENDGGNPLENFDDRINQEEVMTLETFYNARGRGRGRESLGDTWGAKHWALKSYWDDIHGESEGSGHTASFPLLIPVRHIVIFTTKGEIVADFFGGSGTTGIACQNLGRRARMIEISPAYAGVILQRFEDTFPGLPIERIK